MRHHSKLLAAGSLAAAVALVVAIPASGGGGMRTVASAWATGDRFNPDVSIGATVPYGPRAIHVRVKTNNPSVGAAVRWRLHCYRGLLEADASRSGKFRVRGARTKGLPLGIRRPNECTVSVSATPAEYADYGDFVMRIKVDILARR